MLSAVDSINGSDALTDELSQSLKPLAIESVFDRIPAEVLLLIFDFAARHPAASWHPLLRWKDDMCWPRYVRTAKALSLVCKAWHAPAMEVLYSDIVFTSVLQAPLLYRTLATASQKYGQLVKALSVNYPRDDTIGGLESKILAKVVELCPRLDKLAFCQETSSYYGDQPIFWYTNHSIKWTLVVTHLHLTEAVRQCTRLMLEDHFDFLSECVNLQSLTSPYPLLDAAREETGDSSVYPILLPRLRNLLLTIDSGATIPEGAAMYTLPQLHTLTICLKDPPRPAQPHPMMRTLSHLLTSFGPTLRRLHLNFLPDSRTEGWDRLDGGDDQVLIDLCPQLEHFITYAAARLGVRTHPTLQWIDVWTPTPDVGAVHKSNLASALLPADAHFPALRGCRVFDVTLGMFVDLPFIISPDSPVPRDQQYTKWMFAELEIAQTTTAVTWYRDVAYDSDSDSSYAYSSASEEPPEEYESDGGECLRELQQGEVKLRPAYQAFVKQVCNL